MWIAIGVGIPVLILGILVATLPVIRNSMRYHRWEEHRAESGRLHHPIRPRIGCAFCEARFQGETTAEVVAEKNRHVLAEHARTADAADAEVARTVPETDRMRSA